MLILVLMLLRVLVLVLLSIYVDSVRPFFDPENEISDATTRAHVQDKITIISQDTKAGAVGTCLVTTSGISYISRCY